jgi:site-specific recombinase XerD
MLEDAMRGQELVDEWCAWLGAGDLAVGTIGLRRSHLLRLAGVVDLVKAAEGDLAAWLANPRWSTESRRSARASVCAFYRWAERVGHVDVDPAAWLHPIRPATSVPRRYCVRTASGS